MQLKMSLGSTEFEKKKQKLLNFKWCRKWDDWNSIITRMLWHCNLNEESQTSLVGQNFSNVLYQCNNLQSSVSAIWLKSKRTRNVPCCLCEQVNILRSIYVECNAIATPNILITMKRIANSTIPIWHKAFEQYLLAQRCGIAQKCECSGKLCVNLRNRCSILRLLCSYCILIFMNICAVVLMLLYPNERFGLQ